MPARRAAAVDPLIALRDQYHGLMGMDDETLRWIGTRRGLLRRLLEKASANALSDARARRYVERGGPRQALVARWLK